MFVGNYPQILRHLHPRKQLAARFGQRGLFGFAPQRTSAYRIHFPVLAGTHQVGVDRHFQALVGDLREQSAERILRKKINSATRTG